MQAIDTREMPREEWLIERRKGIGGSDAAAILGMNPYISPLAVYMDKLGLAPEREETEAMRQGTDLEQYVAERFCEAADKRVRRRNKMLRHPKYEWMLANIDREVVGERAGLECKTTSVYNRTEFDRGDVPATYYWQCMHYMAVTGYEHWYLAVLVLNRAFHIFKIERDENAIKALVAAEESFWRDHVLAEVPPLPSGSDGDDDLIPLLPNAAARDDVVDLQDLDDDITLMRTYEAEAKSLDAQAKTIKQRVQMALGDAEEGRSNRWRITYKPQIASRIDADRLREERPEIAAEFVKCTTSRPMRIKEAK